MRTLVSSLRMLASGFCAAAFLLSFPAHAAEPESAPAKSETAPKVTTSYGISLFGTLKYGPDFTHFDYVNPKAPKGGTAKRASPASFDNLNSYTLKGLKAPGMDMVFETLMVNSLDEPQTMYGLIAESITRPDDNSWVEFTLNPKATWHDGTPITADDVVFSYETLISKGDPSFKIFYADIDTVKKSADNKVKFTFKNPDNRELPIIAASMPVFSKTYYTTHDFEKTTLEPPMGSGPYEVEAVDQGRSITYKRVADYWGRDLPVNVGQNNFDTIRYDVYTDETVALEAFKAAEYDFREEYIARSWATAYENIHDQRGMKMVKKLIPNEIPQGMQAFIFNQRKTKFADERVREAIGLTMDFEWINKTLFYNAYKRNTSFFANTPFEAKGVPEGKELELLLPFKDQLPPQLFTDAYSPPVTDGSGNSRDNLLKAQKLLDEAGWGVKNGKRVNDETGEPLTIEFMLRQASLERIVAPMRKNLRRLGISATIRIVDDSQYQKRLDEGDFDLVSIWYNRNLFYPAVEQTSYWHSSQADVKGGNNLAGLKNPVVDDLLKRVSDAKMMDDLIPAGRALDRVLLWEQTVIPHWHLGAFRVAYWSKFGIPATLPKYGLGFLTWWINSPLSPQPAAEPVKTP